MKIPGKWFEGGMLFVVIGVAALPFLFGIWWNIPVLIHQWRIVLDFWF
jgi:hypothetical protein